MHGSNSSEGSDGSSSKAYQGPGVRAADGSGTGGVRRSRSYSRLQDHTHATAGIAAGTSAAANAPFHGGAHSHAHSYSHGGAGAGVGGGAARPRPPSAAEVIRAAGYPLQVYDVTTRDGYVLTMERIPRVGCKDVVFFMHGVLDTSMAWVSAGVTGSQAFAAWEAGFDVWLGNSRGNAPRRHQGKEGSPALMT